jgi:hypothetical protein
MTTLPPEVVEFLSTYVSALDDLQVLMSCYEWRERWWDAAGMARELGIGVAAARRALDRLASRNLLDIRITADVRYQFNPGTPELEATATACAAAYRANPVAVVQLVTGGARRSLRDFADAFRFRNDGDR